MYKDLKYKEGAVIVDGMSRFIPSSSKFFFPHSFLLRLNLSLLIIHGSIVLVLWPFRLETVPIGCGKLLVLLSLLLIFILLEIVAGILFDEQSWLSSKCANLLGSPTDKSFISSNFCKSAFPPLIRSDHCVANSPTEKANLFGPSLNYIFYASILSLSLPQCWKLSHVQPIPKKGSRSDPSNYRPVALTCILSQIFETLLNSLLRSSGNSLRSPVRLSLHKVYWRYTFLSNRFMVFRS